MRDRWWSGWRGWIGGPVYRCVAVALPLSVYLLRGMPYSLSHTVLSYRYAGALLLGYRQYQRSTAERPHLLGDGTVRKLDSHEAALYPHLVVPSISMLLVTFFASFISVIALVSASLSSSLPPDPLELVKDGQLTCASAAVLYVVVRNARQGRTSVQGERIKLHRSATYDARLRLWVPLPEGGGAVVLVEPDHDLFDLGPDENWTSLMGETWIEWASPWKPRCVELLADEVRARELQQSLTPSFSLSYAAKSPTLR